MATAVVQPSANRLIFNGDLDVGNGILGEFIAVNAVAADFSIVPGVAPQFFTKYYSFYSITTNATITITLPAFALVAVGWHCKIDMISSTGAGNITIVDSGAIAQAYLAPNTTYGQAFGSVEMISTGTSWIASYGIPKSAANNQIVAIDATGYPTLRGMGFGIFASMCDVGGGAAIDINTLTPTPLRWANPTGKYVDPLNYNTAPAVDTYVQALTAGVYRFTVIIGIANAGGSDQTNLEMRPRVNGVTFPAAFSVTTATIQLFTDGVYCLEAALTLAINDYVEIVVNKTVVSAGTNPIDLANTGLYATLVSY